MTTEQQLAHLRDAVFDLCGHVPGVSQEQQLEALAGDLSAMRACIGAANNQELLDYLLERHAEREERQMGTPPSTNAS